MADTTPYSVPQEPGRWRAIALAVAMHAALFAFFWIGIRWQSETPVAIEAEVWDMQAKDAAPKQAMPPPEPSRPEQESKPRPEPEPEPEAASKPEPKPEVKAPVEKPDIALEQERKKKEKARREEEERQARLKEEKEQAEKEKRAQAEREKQALAEKEKKEEAKKEKEKQLALEKEKAEKTALEKQKAELAKKEKAEAEKKRLADQDAKLLAQLRKDAQKNFAGSGGTGTAAKSQGMRGDAGYAGKVAAKIKSNTAFVVSSDLQGNPAVEFDVQLFPDGSLRGAPRKVKSSGIPAFDEAVRRAIELSAPFPTDKSGTVPSGFPVIHRPKEQ